MNILQTGSFIFFLCGALKGQCHTVAWPCHTVDSFGGSACRGCVNHNVCHLQHPDSCHSILEASTSSVLITQAHIGMQVAVSSTTVPNPEEESKYASPEELLSGGANVSPKSDVYSLGVLFFELFNPVSDDVERSRALQALRHRILPPHVLQVSRQPESWSRSVEYERFLNMS